MNMKKTNYVANDVVMRWLNRSIEIINVMLQLINIFSELTNLCLTVCALVVIASVVPTRFIHLKS